MEPLPTFEDVVALMRSAKPPLACRVVDLRSRRPGASNTSGHRHLILQQR
jgi:hypothetical protein